MRIAWESQGEGAPLLLIHGLGYAREGWGPLREPLAERYRVLVVRQPRHRRERDPARAVHGRGARRRRRRRCSTRPGSSARTSSARASAGWSRRCSRLDSPERVDRLVLALHDAGRRRRVPAAPADAAAHGRGAVARAGGRAAALRRERARAATRGAAGARRRDLRLTGSRTRRSARLGRRRPARARPGTPATGSGRIAAPTLVLHGTADAVVDHRNAQLLADADPRRARRALRRRRPPLLLGGSRGVRALVERFLG